MNTAPHLKIDLVMTNQAQKETTVNEAIITIDALINCGVIKSELNVPPDSPENGDLYIIGHEPINEWQNQSLNVAYFFESWRFIIPNPGLTIWASDAETNLTYNGKKWITTNAGRAVSYLSGKNCYIQLTSHSTNLLTITDNCNIDLNATDVGSCVVIIKQDEIGSHHINWPKSICWPQGITPIFPKDPHNITVMQFIFYPGQPIFGFVLGDRMI